MLSVQYDYCKCCLRFFLEVKTKRDCVYHLKCTYCYRVSLYYELRPYYESIYLGRCISDPPLHNPSFVVFVPFNLFTRAATMFVSIFRPADDVVWICTIVYPFEWHTNCHKNAQFVFFMQFFICIYFNGFKVSKLNWISSNL